MYMIVSWQMVAEIITTKVDSMNTHSRKSSKQRQFFKVQFRFKIENKKLFFLVWITKVLVVNQ